MKYSSINISSEEDVKQKVIIPYLKNLGFDDNELDFETSFSIRLGTKNYKIDGKDLARGRSDILIKRNKDNLFVFEVKKNNKKIDHDDIEQAISYARLVHPIAPFAIITNGKSTNIYDVITKDEIKDISEIGTNSNFNVSIGEDLKYDALKYFIGYSIENIHKFTKEQIEQRMSTLLGNENNLSKKFIPELFVTRNNLCQEFESFLHSADKCFAIVGESGVGKTNCLCDLVNKFYSHNIVLFFNGTFLYSPIVNTIKDDFNWVFSQQLEPVEILKRLEGLTNKANCKVIIFIDAIDEVRNPDFDLELIDIIQKLLYFPSIKLCFTCKTYDIERFETIKGQPSSLKEYLFNNKKFVLERFNEIEIIKIDDKYRKAFKYSGLLTKKLRNDVKLGIMYRILAEVYEGKELPSEFNELELFNEYVKKKLEKLEKLDYESGNNALKEIGKIIIQNDAENNLDKKFSGIVEEDLLREKLNLTLNDKLLPDFFSHNILIRHEEKGEKYVGFYFNRFKDYVIAVLSCNLDKLSGNEFKNMLQVLMKEQNGQESVFWYINLATNEQSDIFFQYYLERCDEFIKWYNKILNEKLFELKEKFDPYTNKEIGVLTTRKLNLDRIDFALLEIDPQKDKSIRVINKNDFTLDVLVNHYKVTTIRNSRFSYMAVNPKQAAREDILKQLEEIVKKEKLNENNNTGLALEKIQAVLYYYSEKFGFEKINDKYKISDIKPLYPINIVDCLNNIKSKMRKDYIVDQRISRMSKSGSRKLSSGEHQLVFDAAEIEKEELEFIKSNKEFPIESSGVRGILYKYMNILFQNKIEIIDDSYLPLPDLSESDSHDRGIKLLGFFQSPTKAYCLYSEKQLVRYVSQFFLTFIEEYKTVIESNFNPIKNYFKLYSCLPVHYRAKINLKGMGIEYGFKRSENGENQVEVTVEENNSDFTKDNDFLSSHYHRIEPMFNQFTASMSDRDLDEISPVRGFVYGRLKSEIRNVIIKLRKDFE